MWGLMHILLLMDNTRFKRSGTLWAYGFGFNSSDLTITQTGAGAAISIDRTKSPLLDIRYNGATSHLNCYRNIKGCSESTYFVKTTPLTAPLDSRHVNGILNQTQTSDLLFTVGSTVYLYSEKQVLNARLNQHLLSIALSTLNTFINA